LWEEAEGVVLASEAVLILAKASKDVEMLRDD
jgi:hypothetical protein